MNRRRNFILLSAVGYRKNNMEIDDFHGIIIEESLSDKEILKKVKVLGRRTSKWTHYKVSFSKGRINEIVKLTQRCLSRGKWYAHFYRNNQLFVVFKDRIFHLPVNNKNSWKDAVDYGLSLGIPRYQLDFKPCKIEEETY